MGIVKNPQLGDTIDHKFGKAIIRQIQHQGLTNKVKIELADGPLKGQMLTILLSLSDSETTEDISARIAVEPSTLGIVKSRDSKKTRDLHKQRCIESLRFGLVPEEFIEDLTLGFDNIKKWTLSTFPDKNKNSPVVHQVSGHFGDGKSHFMSIIRYLAFNQGYLVGRLSVDGQQVSFSKPGTLLHSLFTSLKGKDLSRSMPLLNVYCKAIQKQYNGPSVAPKGKIDKIHENYNLVRLLERNKLLEDCEHLIDSVITCSDDITTTDAITEIKAECRGRSGIKPSDIKIYSMISVKVENHPDDFVEALIGTTLLARLAGYKGLVITIDEYEVEDSVLGGKSLSRAEEILEVFKDYVEGNAEYPKVPLALYFASVPKPEENRDGTLVSQLIAVSNGKENTIPPFEGWDAKNPEQVKLVEKIHTLYQDCYSPTNISTDTLIENLTRIMNTPEIYDSGGIRFFIKHYISLLDTMYGPPHNRVESTVSK